MEIYRWLTDCLQRRCVDVPGNKLVFHREDVEVSQKSDVLHPRAPTAGGTGSSLGPGWGMKIPQAARHSQRKKILFKLPLRKKNNSLDKG